MKRLRFHAQTFEKDDPHDEYSWYPKKASRFRRWFVGVLFLILIIALGAVLLNHSFFSIKTVTVDGGVRHSSQEIEQFIKGAMNSRKFFILPENNYFLVNTQELGTLVQSRYPIAHVAFSKEFPNTLRVRIEETPTAIIYDNTAQYASVGPNGTIVELLRHVADDEWTIKRETVTSTVMVTSTNEFGEQILVAQEKVEEKEISRTHVPPGKLTNEFGAFPVLLDTRGQITLSGDSSFTDQIVLPAVIAAVREWQRLLEQYVSVRVRYTEIRDNSGDVFIKTNETYEIRARVDDIPNQFTALKHLLENEIPKNAFINYIDLRYKEKLYWQ